MEIEKMENKLFSKSGAEEKEVENKTHESLEDPIISELESFERSEKEAVSLLNEVGGPEGINKTLDQMKPEKITELKGKILEAYKKQNELRTNSSEASAVIELPVFISSLFGYVAAISEPKWAMAYGVLSLASAAWAGFFSYLSMEDGGKFESGITEAIKSMKEGRRIKKMEAELNGLEKD